MKRHRIFLCVIILMMLFLVSGLAWFQIKKGESYYRKSENNRIRSLPFASPRGRILDRDGVVLADNRASFEVSIIPEEIRQKESFVIPLLVELIKDDDLTYEKIEKKIKSTRAAPFVPVRIKKDLEFDAFARIEENLLDMPGVTVRPYVVREYPYHDLAGHVIGYTGAISSKEYERLKGSDYQKWDMIGKTGTEKTYDTILRGRRGWKNVEITASGRHVENLKEIKVIPGSDLMLTIDHDVQRIAQNAFQDYRGACAVIQSGTGDILALVSSPGLDVSSFGESPDTEALKEYFQDTNKPFINRAIQASYSPGSVFKIVLAIAGLSTEVITEDTKFYCNGEFPIGGRRFRCMGRHGHVSLTEALERSCNIYFYNLGLKLGPNTMAEYSKKLGLGQASGIDLPYERQGIVPSTEWKKNYFKNDKRWYDGETAVFAIGQGFLEVTPLQLGYAANALVNGGKLFTPKLVKKVYGSEIVSPHEVVSEYTDLSFNPYHLMLIKQGMYQVVHSPNGTGRRAKLDGYEIGGKTGTVQVKRHGKSQPDHGWFFGFSPIDKPIYSIIVFIENQGAGGHKPARIAREIFKGIWTKEETRKLYVQTN